jgi:hypothetical protein
VPSGAVAVGFAVGRAVTFSAIALDPGCFALDFGPEAGAAARVGLADELGAEDVPTAADAGVEPAPTVAGVGAVPAQPATANTRTISGNWRPMNVCARA